jgi:hypothetical protein
MASNEEGLVFLWNYSLTDHATIVAGKPAPNFVLLGLVTRTYDRMLVLAPRDILKIVLQHSVL